MNSTNHRSLSSLQTRFEESWHYGEVLLCLLSPLDGFPRRIRAASSGLFPHLSSLDCEDKQGMKRRQIQCLHPGVVSLRVSGMDRNSLPKPPKWRLPSTSKPHYVLSSLHPLEISEESTEMHLLSRSLPGEEAKQFI